MSFVVYNKKSTILAMELISNRSFFPKNFDTEQGAKAYLTRQVNKGKMKLDEWAISDKVYFHGVIEKIITKRNLMSGKEFSQPINTPLCCDPSSETYWCM